MASVSKAKSTTATAAATASKAKSSSSAKKATTTQKKTTTTVKDTAPKVSVASKNTVTKKDGTKKTTIKKSDGTQVKVTEKPDGTKTKTTKKADGTKTSTNYRADGSKAKTTTKKADGTKTTTTYNKNSQKTKKVVTNSKNGTTKTTNYEYGKNNQIKSAKTETTVKNAQTNKQEVVKRSEVTYNENGLKDTKVVKDANDVELSQVKYAYNKDGNLVKTVKTQTNGDVVTTKYDSATGNKKSSKKVDANGLVTSRAQYNTSTGKKIGQEKYTYDENGSLVKTRDYTYNSDGTLSERRVSDASGQVTMISKYSHNDDNSKMTRLDYTPSGEFSGSVEFVRDKNENTIQKTSKNAEGKVVSVVDSEYYSSGIKSKDTKKDANGMVVSESTYAPNGVTERNVKYSYNANGLSKTTIKTYDANGRVTEKNEENALTGAKKTTTYALNENGKPESATVVDEKGNEVSKISFKYDENGRRTGKVNTFTDGTFTSEEYTYSQDGKITKEVLVDRKGGTKTVERVYDTEVKTQKDEYGIERAVLTGNQTQTEIITNSDGTKTSKTVNYDKNGIVSVSETDANGVTTETKYSYDILGRVSAMDVKTGDVQKTTNYTYYGNSERLKTFETKDSASQITKEVSFSQSGSVQYKEANPANQTKTLFVDKDFNGSIDSKAYFQEDAKGNTIKASYDDDNDGKIDKVLTSDYDENGNLTGIATDIGNKGFVDQYEAFKDGKLVATYTYQKDEEKGVERVWADTNADGIIDFVSQKELDANGRVKNNFLDYDNDGKFEQVLNFEYDEQGNMIGRYSDNDNDGVYDVYDKFKGEEIISSEKIKKKYK